VQKLHFTTSRHCKESADGVETYRTDEGWVWSYAWPWFIEVHVYEADYRRSVKSKGQANVMKKSSEQQTNMCNLLPS